MKTAIFASAAAAIVLANIAQAGLYWSQTWAQHEAHCGPWRQGCRSQISDASSVDKFAICKIIQKGQWSVIRGRCPDPADPQGTGEADRIKKILHDSVNYLEVIKYTNVQAKGTPDDTCRQFQTACGQAVYDSGRERTGGFSGMCDITTGSDGQWIAAAACSEDGVGEKLGWTPL